MLIVHICIQVKKDTINRVEQWLVHPRPIFSFSEKRREAKSKRKVDKKIDRII